MEQRRADAAAALREARAAAAAGATLDGKAAPPAEKPGERHEALRLALLKYKVQGLWPASEAQQLCFERLLGQAPALEVGWVGTHVRQGVELSRAHGWLLRLARCLVCREGDRAVMASACISVPKPSRACFCPPLCPLPSPGSESTTAGGSAASATASGGAAAAAAGSGGGSAGTASAARRRRRGGAMRRGRRPARTSPSASAANWLS